MSLAPFLFKFLSERLGVCFFRREGLGEPGQRAPSQGRAPAGPGHAEPASPATLASRRPRAAGGARGHLNADTGGPGGTARALPRRAVPSRRGAAWIGGAQWAGTAGLARPPAAGRPEPASLSRSSAVMVADQRLPRVPAEPGTIPRLCELLLGAGETKGKCQEHVNQTRYSVTITSLSGLPGPQHPWRTPRTGPTPARGPRAYPGDRPTLCPSSPEVSAWAGRKDEP